MKREIKCQGWNGTKLCEVRQIHFDADLKTLFWFPRKGYPNKFYQDCEEYPLRWFTGLHDKNGKDVYEGDKLLFRSEEDESLDRILVVKWDNLLCGWSLYDDVSDEEAFEPFSDVIGEYFEVIGNIYENPELLK
jgi:uncharacterized phage protein (TIGR01671 family)